MKNIVIFDLDGTLALIDHRRHLVEKKLAWEMHLQTLPPEDIRSLRITDYMDRHMERWVKSTAWKPNWDEFYNLCDKDEPNTPVIEVFKHLRSSHSDKSFKLIIFSGRSEVVREKTEFWLENNGIQPEKLYLRPDNDYTPDDYMKRKWLNELGGHERVFCVFDDRQKVVDMWRSYGITCFQVAPGNF
jgi:phosphoglycolate phosphatase-like HAD superfamily hydrolase